MVTAALLLALLSPQEPALYDLRRAFLDGTDAESAAARRTLATRGVAALPALAQARGRKDLKRRDDLDALHLQIKAGSTDEIGRRSADAIQKTRVSVAMQDAPVCLALDHFREILGLEMVEDPGHPQEPALVTLVASDVPFWRVLDALCARVGLDYDFRCGVVVLATPERLWAVPRPGAPLPDMQAIRALVADLGSDSPHARDQAAAELRKFGAGAIPFLKEAEGSSDSEIVERSKELVWELMPLTRRWSAIPETAAWRFQKLDGADLSVARKLDQMTFDFGFESAKVHHVLEFVRDISAFKIEVRAPHPNHEITFKVKDLPLGQCLELLILPLGLDLRIEGGAIEIIARK